MEDGDQNADACSQTTIEQGKIKTSEEVKNGEAERGCARQVELMPYEDEETDMRTTEVFLDFVVVTTEYAEPSCTKTSTKKTDEEEYERKRMEALQEATKVEVILSPHVEVQS